MVKKLFCLLLTLFTLALVVGCGNDNAKPANNDKIKVHLGIVASYQQYTALHCNG